MLSSALRWIIEFKVYFTDKEKLRGRLIVVEAEHGL